MTKRDNSLCVFVAAFAVWALAFSTSTFGQDIYPPPGSAIIDPGTIINVRTNGRILAEDSDGRVFSGTVDQDVRDRKGTLKIQKGSDIELMVRRDADSVLALDLDSITINGQRYSVQTDENAKSRGNGAALGAIIGAMAGAGRGAATGAGAQLLTRGRTVDVPDESLLTFRLTEPLRAGMTDQGYMQNGYHYHYGYGGDTLRAKPSVR